MGRTLITILGRVGGFEWRQGASRGLSAMLHLCPAVFLAGGLHQILLPRTWAAWALSKVVNGGPWAGIGVL